MIWRFRRISCPSDCAKFETAQMNNSKMERALAFMVWFGCRFGIVKLMPAIQRKANAYNYPLAGLLRMHLLSANIRRFDISQHDV